MSFWKNVWRSNFFIRLKSWEYWPFGIVQFPAMMYYFWLSIRARSFLFFSASNPGIPMGGMFGESKFDVLKKIPERYIPKTILITLPCSVEDVLNLLKEGDLLFPVIFKPDLGERGYMVKKIDNRNDIEVYLRKIKINFIAQELISFPVELGVFYTRFPNEKKGRVTSITKKEMLHVRGDGHSTLLELILKKDRAKLQWPVLKEIYCNELGRVLYKGEILELISIGNHCLGTKFIDANHIINDKLSDTFDTISKQISGFYFGRFDLRCATLDDLYGGRIKIMELNGCGAEPAHVYNPGYSFFKAVGVFCVHWQNIYCIARENHRRGVQYTTAGEALKYYRSFKASLQKR